MKSVLTGIALVVLISGVAWFASDRAVVPSAVAYSSPDAVRLDPASVAPADAGAAGKEEKR